MDDRARRVEEHLREGLYLLSIGQVREGRRAWRRALECVPGHPVVEDYLQSTDRELTETERLQEEIELRGGPEDASTDGWDEEVTSELDSLWGAKGTPPSQVTPPGESRNGDAASAWEMGPEVGWDASSAPMEGELPTLSDGEAVPWTQTKPSPWNDDTPTEVGPGYPDPGFDRAQTDEGRAPDPVIVTVEDPDDDDEGDSLEELLGKAVAAFHGGDHPLARSYLDALLLAEPGNTTALTYLRQIREALIAQLSSDATPERTVEMEAISKLNLDMVEGYIISRIDGMTTVEDLFSLSSHLDPDRVTEVLCTLLEQGVIRLRQV